MAPPATTKKGKKNEEFEIKVGLTCKISDNESGEVTGDIWSIDTVDDEEIEVTNTESGETDKVHPSRIAIVINDEENEIPNPDFKSEMDEDDEKATKPKKPKKDKQEATPVNFATLSKEGEVWSKEMPFDHEGMTTQSHCIIAKDGGSFRCFNTYNGSLGKNNKVGTSYVISDDKALTRKRKQLQKQGYELAHENEELNSLINEAS